MRRGAGGGVAAGRWRAGVPCTATVSHERRHARHQVNFTSSQHSKTYGSTVSLTKRGKPHGTTTKAAAAAFRGQFYAGGEGSGKHYAEVGGKHYEEGAVNLTRRER